MTLRLARSLRKRFLGAGLATVERASHDAYDADMDDVRVNIDKPWLSVADICEYMDVSAFVVTSVLRSGELPAVKFGREWRVAKQDFEVWINSQRRPAAESSDEPSGAIG